MFVRASSSQTFLVVNQTSNALIFYFPVNLHLGHENNLLPIWLSPVNYKIKFSHIKLGLQYTWLYMYFKGYTSILIIILNNWKSFVKTDIFSVVEGFFSIFENCCHIDQVCTFDKKWNVLTPNEESLSSTQKVGVLMYSPIF